MLPFSPRRILSDDLLFGILFAVVISLSLQDLFAPTEYDPNRPNQLKEMNAERNAQGEMRDIRAAQKDSEKVFSDLDSTNTVETISYKISDTETETIDRFFTIFIAISIVSIFIWIIKNS